MYYQTEQPLLYQAGSVMNYFGILVLDLCYLFCYFYSVCMHEYES